MKKKPKYLVELERELFPEKEPQELEVNVTCINGRYYARLYRLYDFNENFIIDTTKKLDQPVVVSEAACDDRMDIGYICRHMIRWYDKCSGGNKFTSAVRHRMWNHDKYPQESIGKVYFSPNIPKRKSK